MISQLFLKVLNMSLTASLVILFVLVARLILRKAPRIFSYCLWAAVLFRLLCPVSFSSSLSLFGALGNAQVEQGSLEYISEEMLVGTQEQLQSPVTNQVAKPGQLIQQEKRPDMDFVYPTTILVLSFLWIAGVVVIAVYDMVTLQKFQSKLEGAVKVRENIYTSTLPTPFVMGMFRPRIYLPANLQGEEREYILLHEQIHIRRGDHLMKLLASVALCIHWFNPLVWVAFFLSSKDMEMSCDEAVLRKMGNRVKKEYSASLLNLATAKRVISGVPLAFGEGNTGSRIKNVLGYKKPAIIVVCIAVVVCLVLGICLVSNPTTESDGEQSYFFQRLTSFFSPDEDASGSPEDNIAGRENQADRNGAEDADNQVTTGQQAEQKSEEAVQNSQSAEQSQQEATDETAENTFYLSVRNISVEDRTIDVYIGADITSYEGGAPYLFAPDCVFEVNYQMDKLEYEQVSFETFAQIINNGHAHLEAPVLNNPCFVTMDEGGEQISHIRLQTVYESKGIGYDSYPNESGSYIYHYLKEEYGENVLEEQFQLVSTLEADIADCDGMESIEIYIGVLEEYEEVGLLLYKNAQGELLRVDGEYSSAYPTTYYVNETPEGSYLMRIHAENRDTHGEYNYYVYRMGEDGSIKNIAGSYFYWSSSEIYDEELFRQWVDNLNGYFKGSQLLMESREDEIGVSEPVDEECYSFDNLDDFTKYYEVTLY